MYLNSSRGRNISLSIILAEWIVHYVSSSAISDCYVNCVIIFKIVLTHIQLPNEAGYVVMFVVIRQYGFSKIYLILNGERIAGL